VSTIGCAFPPTFPLDAKREPGNRGAPPRPLLVGEANPYGGDPEFALYPSPPGCSGDRLCRLVMGLDPDDYLERFDWVNLCPSRWSTRAARGRADEIAAERAGGVVVLLGAKVAGAFGHAPPHKPFAVLDGAYRDQEGAPRLRFVVLPHPSGLSRAWGVPGAYERARSVLRGAGVL